MPALRLVPYGQAATRALRDAIVEAKAGDTLAPVSVAVPSNYAGLSLRRTLGVAELSLDAVSGRQGLVNVRFLVFARIAELLGAPLLAASNKRPLARVMRAEAVRAAVEANPGVFERVAEHPATGRGLDATFRDLSRATSEALDAVAGCSERAGDVVRLYRDFKRRAAAFYDEEDLAFAAAKGVEGPALRDVGHVVLYLPRRLSPAEFTLAKALAEIGALTAIIGRTGDDEADVPLFALASQLESALGEAASEPPDQPPTGTAIVTATDAEEEVRTVLRLVADRLEHGTPLHRMAVLYPVAEPYALLANEQFQAAGIPHNGRAVRTLAQTLAGRTLLGVLRLRDRDLRRDEVMDWLSSGPVLERLGGRRAPAQRWDAVSRSAGIVKGADQWQRRLARHRRTLEQQLAGLERTDEGDEWRARRIEIDLDQLAGLTAFIDELVQRIEPGRLASWADFARWGRDLLTRYLGGESNLQHPRTNETDEIEAYRAVEAALDALSPLDELRGQANEPVFRRALERELETPAARVGRFGEGVFIGRVADAMGTDFDVVFLLGMTEGLMPPRSRDDPLLPDRERSTGGEEMPLRAGGRAEQRREYLAALAAGRQSVLVHPRSDLRGQRGKLPAPWLLETASRLEGRSLFSADLDSLSERSWLTTVPSFESALARGGAYSGDGRLPVASEQEYNLRSLLDWRASGATMAEHYLATEHREFRAGLQAGLARQSSELTAWDGRVGASEELAPSIDRPVSATALQNYAACPFRYFLGHVLRIAETEKPEDTLVLSPLERGNLIHSALETFVRETPTRTAPDEPWSDAERTRLSEIAEELCSAAEEAGVTGRPLLWRLERGRILRDLDGFLDHDEALRREHGVVPAAVELSFGLPGDDQPALIVPLDGDRVVAFRGRVDRVDRATDGSRLLVLDYKSGSDERYRQLAKDPMRRGQLLQLPVYALAARERYDDVPAAAFYWFISERADYRVSGYDIEQPVMGEFRDALSVIVGGIGDGLFPARPGGPRNANCMFCPFDRVCPRDRNRAFQRKRGTPALHDYLSLAEPED